MISPRLTENKNHHHAQQLRRHEEKPPQEMVCNFAARLTVKTEGLDAREE